MGSDLGSRDDTQTVGARGEKQRPIVLSHVIHADGAGHQTTIAQDIAKRIGIEGEHRILVPGIFDAGPRQLRVEIVEVLIRAVRAVEQIADDGEQMWVLALVVEHWLGSSAAGYESDGAIAASRWRQFELHPSAAVPPGLLHRRCRRLKSLTGFAHRLDFSRCEHLADHNVAAIIELGSNLLVLHDIDCVSISVLH